METTIRMNDEIEKTSVAEDVMIRGEKIDLDQFMKLSGMADTGGAAKLLIRGGMVTVNGEPELRARRTLVIGDLVVMEGQGFKVTAGVAEAD